MGLSRFLCRCVSSMGLIKGTGYFSILSVLKNQPVPLSAHSGVTVNDVAEIIEQHLVGGKVVERLAWLDHDKLHQTIAENRAKAQARQAG